MDISRFLLILVCAAVAAPHPACASGRAGHLDEFCRTAEYIVVAECLEHTEHTAKLQVEAIHKAPRTDPKPTVLAVNGHLSSATRFSFQKGKRYFAFVFEGGSCDRQGSHIEVEDDGTLSRAAHELICLKRDTDTLDKLTRQVRSVLSGDYEAELIARIGNRSLDYESRRTSAIALSRASPGIASEPIAKLLLEISRPPDTDGSSRDLFMVLLKLAPKRARDTALEILSNTDSFELFFEAADVLATPECKLDDFPNHLPALVRAAHAWQQNNPPAGHVHMLPVFINNDCRNAEVKHMLLSELSSPKCSYFDRLMAAAIRIPFPEVVPLFWNQVKQERQVSDLVNLDFHIAQHVGASTVYDHEQYERLVVWMGVNVVRAEFPQFAEGIADAEVIRLNKSFLFLVRPDEGATPTCLYVGYVRQGRGKIAHKAFMLFGDK
jgi:hypothetical protein